MTIPTFVAGTELTAAELNSALADTAALPMTQANTWTAPQTFDAPIIQTPGQGANNQTPFLQAGDLVGPYVVSGLLDTVPGTASLTSTMPGGQAYALGTGGILQRVVSPGATYTYAASSDTYVDLSDTGVLTYSAVANGATAPAVAADSLRLEKVVTDAVVSPLPTLAASTAAGTLAAGTYEYQLVAHDATGYGLPSAPLSITTTATGEVVLTWVNPLNETSMDIYGRVAGSIGLLAAGVTGTTWTDDGSATVGAAPPTTATSNAIQSVTPLAQIGHAFAPVSYPGNSAGTILLADAPVGQSLLSSRYADGPFLSVDNLYSSLIVTNGGGGTVYQKFISYNNDGAVYSRYYNGGSWSQWGSSTGPQVLTDTSTTPNVITVNYTDIGNNTEAYSGQEISVFVANTNTGPTTLNSVNVYSLAGELLQGGELTKHGGYYRFIKINSFIYGWILIPSGVGSLQIGGATASNQAIPLGQANSLYQSSQLSVASTTTAGSITATAAQLTGGYLADGATQTAAFTVTTDTAANILAAMPNAAVGTSFKWRFINNDQSATGYAGTLAGGTGVTIGTILPNPAVPKGGYEDYVFTFTAIGSAPTLTVEAVGGSSAALL